MKLRDLGYHVVSLQGGVHVCTYTRSRVGVDGDPTKAVKRPVYSVTRSAAPADPRRSGADTESSIDSPPYPFVLMFIDEVLVNGLI